MASNSMVWGASPATWRSWPGWVAVAGGASLAAVLARPTGTLEGFAVTPSPWSAGVPLAVAATLGLVGAIAQALSGRRAALLTVLALVTMPAEVQASALPSSDAFAMLAFTAAVAALGALGARTRLGVVGLALALAAVLWQAKGFVLQAMAERTAATDAPRVFTSFVGVVAAAVGPWAALLPWAVLHMATVGGRGEPVRRSLSLAVVAVAFAAVLLPRDAAGMIVPAAAILCGCTLEAWLERRPSAFVLLAVAALAVLVARDAFDEPRRALSLGQPSALPPALATTISRASLVGGGLAAALFAAVALDGTEVRRPLVAPGISRALLLVAAFAPSALFPLWLWPRTVQSLSVGHPEARYRELARPGEPLGVLQVGSRSAPPAAATFAAPAAAAEWLFASPDRRWLTLPRTELAPLLAERRVREGSAATIAVASPAEGAWLLTSNAMPASVPSENLFAKVLPLAPPPLSHPAPVRFGSFVESLGVAVRDDDGRLLDSVAGGQRFHVALAFRVLAPPPPDHCTFVHIETRPHRWAAEHRPVDLPYPLALWRAGDLVIDDFEVRLPRATAAGSYAVAYGLGVLPCSDDRRAPITSGEHDDGQRASGGALRVR